MLIARELFRDAANPREVRSPLAALMAPWRLTAGSWMVNGLGGHPGRCGQPPQAMAWGG